MNVLLSLIMELQLLVHSGTSKTKRSRAMLPDLLLSASNIFRASSLLAVAAVVAMFNGIAMGMGDSVFDGFKN